MAGQEDLSAAAQLAGGEITPSLQFQEGEIYIGECDDVPHDVYTMSARYFQTFFVDLCVRTRLALLLSWDGGFY